uniref:Uncharacterized protein n=1 Tax=Amphora coffeiformis TaxID=265554 RepID=A0A7S3P5H8_9STRA|eukprot:scaffold1029_cov194-Amphora_coffeaeformis.AAC.3
MTEVAPRRGSMELNEFALPRSCRRRSLAGSNASQRNLTESCHSVESLGYEVLEERRPNRRASMSSCRSFESEMMDSLSRHGFRRASLDRSQGYWSFTKSSSNENLMESCRSFESRGSEMIMNSIRAGQKRGSLSRANGTRFLIQTDSTDGLTTSCHSCDGYNGRGAALDRRRGGLRRSQSSRIIPTTSPRTTKICHFNGRSMDSFQPSWNTSLNHNVEKSGGAERRSSLSSLSSTVSLHRRVAKRDDPLSRHNSVSTMNTTYTVVEEVEAMIEDVKQAIRQKLARQATLKSHIQCDKELAKARYMSENEMGAILSMRRIHKLTAQMEKVRSTCSELLQLQKQLEQALKSAEGIYNLDLIELQSSLEKAFNVVEDEDHVMPSDADLREDLHLLTGRFEI